MTATAHYRDRVRVPVVSRSHQLGGSVGSRGDDVGVHGRTLRLGFKPPNTPASYRSQSRHRFYRLDGSRCAYMLYVICNMLYVVCYMLYVI